jgi:hypothetical protein
LKNYDGDGGRGEGEREEKEANIFTLRKLHSL